MTDDRVTSEQIRAWLESNGIPFKDLVEVVLDRHGYKNRMLRVTHVSRDPNGKAFLGEDGGFAHEVKYVPLTRLPE